MNAADLAQRAYATASTPIRTPRGTEYDVFAQVTRQLKAAIVQRDTNFPSFVAAIHANLQLWILLAGDVATEDNALTPDLRARIFYLYEFTMQHTKKLLAGGEDAGILIEINMTIMRGLRGSGDGA